MASKQLLSTFSIMIQSFSILTLLLLSTTIFGQTTPPAQWHHLDPAADKTIGLSTDPMPTGLSHYRRQESDGTVTTQLTTDAQLIDVRFEISLGYGF